MVIQDINNNGCQEIVLAHPHHPELLCLDGQEGAELWRAQLLDAANIQTAVESSLCPIVLQAFDHEVGEELCVVVAPHDPTLAATNRWLMSVDPVLGKVLWKLASQQSLSKPTNTTVAAARPLHLQWGEVEKRPIEFGYRTTYNYLTTTGLTFQTAECEILTKTMCDWGRIGPSSYPSVATLRGTGSTVRIGIRSIRSRASWSTLASFQPIALLPRIYCAHQMVGLWH